MFIWYQKIFYSIQILFSRMFKFVICSKFMLGRGHSRKVPVLRLGGNFVVNNFLVDNLIFGRPATNTMPCFRNDEDKEHAISVLDGFNLKGRILKACRQEVVNVS
jgi:hypothetical protein